MALQAVCVSAPGKVILHGEHAVVYGKLALAASLNLRTQLQLIPHEEPTLVLELPDVRLHCTWPLAALADLQPAQLHPSTPTQPTPEILARLQELAQEATGATGEPAQVMAVVAFLFLYTNIVGVRGAKISVRSQLPIGAGLGSSAAFCVCVAAGALLSSGTITASGSENGCKEQGTHTSEPTEGQSNHATTTTTNTNASSSNTASGGTHSSPTPGVGAGVGTRPPGVVSMAGLDVVNAWAFQAERLVHGNPSGIDNCISTYGGARRFALGSSEPMQNMPRLRILLVNTRVPRSTKALVAKVREHHTLVPRVLDAILEAMAQLSSEAETKYAELSRLQEAHAGAEAQAAVLTKMEYLIDANQALLCAIGVGHAALDKVCAIARDHGLHAKLTGAGGGGCAWILVPEGKEAGAVGRALEGEGMAVWETSMGGEGLTVDPLP